ncbi:MAG: cytochrome b/b6 domain-containing protein [Candidatus Dactylopiibacterium sp.]|nr:cytochrome b/b6 domain-containing protein [Candidatus Dactylopiibacterium sp.]
MNRRHHPVIRVLHWAVALMVLAALIMSTFVMSRMPDSDPEKLTASMRHMAVGLLICVGTLARLFYRRRTKRLPALSSGMAWADVLAAIVHRSLDILVLTMVVSGIAMALMSGLPRILLEGGAFPGEITGLSAFTIHATVAMVLAGVLALHIGGALFHQFILRDGLIGRMGFALPALRQRVGARLRRAVRMG